MIRVSKGVVCRKDRHSRGNKAVRADFKSPMEYTVVIYTSITANVDTTACRHQNCTKTNACIVTYAYQPSLRNQ